MTSADGGRHDGGADARPWSSEADLLVDEAAVSTGRLSSRDEALALLRDEHQRAAAHTGGQVASYIPALAEADPAWFGSCVAGVDGTVLEVGDSALAFSVQSVSKPFVFALVLEARGVGLAREVLGLNATGLPFDSVVAMELQDCRTTNPMVNAGAIATASWAPGTTAQDRWRFVSAGLSDFAGRGLGVDERVLASERATNRRNRGIAHLLAAYDVLGCDPEVAVDVYTQQCSLSVTARDLALMAATLADGGVNPLTGVRVVSATTAARTLAVMATAGLYERSGEWLFDVGLPGKSGVSGGVVAVAPGKAGLGVFAPPLDTSGNSVRGVQLTTALSRRLGLNLFASRPYEP